VPRELFVPRASRHRAYLDTPLAIGDGQTISQPYIVAYMTEALQLQAEDRALEIGTGSGYGAAVLAEIAREVVTVERNATLAERAREALDRAGYDNVRVVVGDGSLGWPSGAPYEAITVTAGSPSVPDALLGQLALGGRMVIPVGPFADGQQLLRIRRAAPDRLQRERLLPVRFVPLLGKQGWSTDE
jgi:protein-L-isoaspartate(D-aspartate) O-methyltransferase